jgi:hypothetical protein
MYGTHFWNKSPNKNTPRGHDVMIDNHHQIDNHSTSV